MNNPAADPLAALKDIHLPAPVSSWPPAWGWWFLAIVLIGASIAAFVYLRRRHQAGAYRRQASIELAQIEQCPHRDSEWLQSLNQLLKRCAQSAFPLRDVAGLHGKRWGEFLQQHAPRSPNPNSGDDTLIELLTSGGYRSSDDIASRLSEHQQALLDFSGRWIKQHRVNTATVASDETLGVKNAEH